MSSFTYTRVDDQAAAVASALAEPGTQLDKKIPTQVLADNVSTSAAPLSDNLGRFPLGAVANMEEIA